MYTRNVILALFLALYGVRSQGGIFSGTNAVSAVYYGTNVVSAVYYGSNLVWSSTLVAERTDFGAWMHLDASLASSISNQPAGGTNFVYQWTDWRTNSVYARLDDYYDTNMPFVSAAHLNGRAVMRFQPFSAVGGRRTGAPSLSFMGNQTVRSDIFAVFSVIKSNPNSEWLSYIGGIATYDFAGREYGGYLYHSVYSSVRIRNGTNAVDGVVQADASLIAPTNGFHVISMRTSGGGVAGSNLCRDRNFRAGGIDFAELLIFTNPVSDAVTSQIETYLKAKWATP